MFVFAGVVPLLIIGVAMVGLLAGRAELDPDHERPRALFVAATTYLAVLALLAGCFFAVDGLTGGNAASLLGGVIIAAIAAGALSLSAPRLRDTPPRGPGGRVVKRCLYLACFAAVLTAAVASGSALFHVFVTATPQSFGDGNRGDAARAVVNGVVMTAVAVVVFVRSWSLADDLHSTEKQTVHAE